MPAPSNAPSVKPPAPAVARLDRVAQLARVSLDAAADLEEHQPLRVAVLQEPGDLAHRDHPALAPEMEARARAREPALRLVERDEVGLVAQAHRQLDLEVRVLPHEHR